MKYLTKQQIFSKVAKHLLKQNKQSINKTGACLYKSGSLKCAIGCLILDKKYDPKIDINFYNIKKLFEGDYLSGIRNTSEIFNLLVDLQYLHDGFPPTTWKTRLKRTAAKFKLKLPRLES